MHPISRRTFLVSAAAIAVAACSDGGDDNNADVSTTAPTTSGDTSATAPGTTSPVPAADLPGDPFTLGVASGDPDAASVVLWTRLAPDPLNGGGMPDTDIDVLWEVSASEVFDTIAASGIATAQPAHAHSLHVIAAIDPGSWYYRFRVGDYTSPVGRAVITPADGSADSARFAAASCQHYETVQYAAHRDIAEQQPDFVVWLGDYIYEYAGPEGGQEADRVHLGPEITDLASYRNRYARYKSDPNLQAAHAACPWFVIWDDHEVENNYAGLVSEDDVDEAEFRARRFAGYQAWWEHQPVRLGPPADENTEYRIYRDFQWGDLIELAMLDGRQYRSDQACGDVALNLSPACAENAEPSRTMLGDEQEQWLLDTLAGSPATWNVVGNQVVMADATFNGAVLNYDQWDGYPAARARLMQELADRSIENLVVITGDIHLAAVAHLRTGDPANRVNVGVEFVTTSISSEGLVGDELTDVLKSFPDLVDAELAHRGYVLHTVTRDLWSADYRIVADVSDAAGEVTTYSTYEVEAGSNTVTAK